MNKKQYSEKHQPRNNGRKTKRPDPNINSIKKCDIRSISKIISKIENEYDDRILSDIFTLTGKAYKIGITGPPGAGKSTITNLLIN